MNRHPTPTRRGLAAVTALSVLACQVAVPPQAAEASHVGSSTASAGSVAPPTATAVQSFQPDLFTGRATTSVPIAVPAGRKGMQPALGLAYSSSARNGWVGMGWGLDLGYIERTTKNGVPKYDATDTYTFMFQGVSSELVSIGGNEYRAKDEGLFLRFRQVDGTWNVQDKSGTLYHFGRAAASQIVEGSRVFRWALDQVVDLNGNGLTITYTTDQGQLYPHQILYTTHASGAPAPINRVTFTLESRTDIETSYRTGFAVTTGQRLKTIVAEVLIGSAWQLARRYALTYNYSQRTSRSLLAGVQQFGTDGVTSLPATSFDYQDTGAASYSLTSSDAPSVPPSWNLRVANMDTGRENFGCVNPYAGMPWSSPTTFSSSAGISCVSASVDGGGGVRMNGCQDAFGHAYTFVRVNSARTISVPLATSSDVDGCVWREDAGGITQVGTNGSVTLQPGWTILHVTGYHQHQGWGPLWINSALASQVDEISASQFIKPQLAGDVDGNGVTDLVTMNATTNANGHWTVARGQSFGFSPPQTWLSNFGDTSSVPLMGDWNADGLTDIAVYNSGAWQFALSRATYFETVSLAAPNYGSSAPLTGDFNGDGLVDVGGFDNGTWRVALNSGSSFNSTDSFNLVWGSGLSPLTGDFNGDGLTDIATVQASSGTIEVRFSTGSGWAAPTTWRTNFGTTHQTHTTADFNGDGLTDAAFYNRGTGQVTYAPSTGRDFAPPQTLPVIFSQRSSDDHLQVADLNGDGHADPGVFNTFSGDAEMARSSTTFPDLLNTVRNGLGGATTLEYQASTQCDNNCPIELVPKLPFILPVVHRVTTDDGMGHSYSATYLYKQGRYDALTREFRGFGKVEARDALANTTTTFFHQDEHNKGRPYRTEMRDTMDKLWSAGDQIWSCTESSPGVHFVRLDRTEARTFDGNATSRATASRFTYDAYGNITRTDEEGDVAVSGDERASVTSYTLNPALWILNKPATIQTLNTGGQVVAQRWFYYDGATQTTTLPTIGQLTREEEWLDQEEDPATHAFVAANRWLATTLEYDAFGNVTKVRDALGRETTNTYDATSTYLIQIANHLGHTRQLEYDALFGQVTRSIDQNAQPTRTEYDALGRPLRVFGPLSDVTPVLTYEYLLAPVPPSRTITRVRVSLDTAEELVTYAFTDGLGRTIQTRSPAEDPAKQIVNGAAAYDALGRVIQQWVPYIDDFSTSFRAHTLISGLATPAAYEYDTLGRIVKTIDPDGTESTVAYDDGQTTSMVAGVSERVQRTDIYGRLKEVEEVHSVTERHLTRYFYDTLNNLITVIDPAGNRTDIVYDSLGRKIGMDDPDMGTWTYAYDDVDNLIRQTDARLVETRFAYDALNHLKQKTYVRPAGSAIPLPATVTYTYDGLHSTPPKPNSVGKLSAIADGSGVSTFQYDILGRLTKESKTINGAVYTTERAYDLLGRLTLLIYPMTTTAKVEKAQYTYNRQGGIETVTLLRNENFQTIATHPIISDVTYNAAGQITQMVYGNGVVTDYSYHPLTLRLASLHTAHPAAGTLQQFAYGFDPLGNVSSITGAAANVGGGTHPVDQTFTYDKLSRLTRAQGPYGDFHYAYDPLGNMTSKEGMSMVYGQGAGPHAVTSTSGIEALQMTYDANGSMLRKEPVGQPLTRQDFVFDAENRLVEVKTAQETTVSVTFQPGWNFFSLPVLPEHTAVADLFPEFAQDFEQIARPVGDETFEHYVGQTKFDEFTELEYGVGYQVYAKQQVTIPFTGKVPSQRLSKSLPAGWHLLPALVVDTPKPTSWLTQDLSADAVLKIDSATGLTAPATETAAGQAYWVHLTQAGVFSPSLPRDPTTAFTYDGDGGRVKQTTSAGTTLYLGELHEQAPDGTVTKSLFAGSQRLASLVIPPSGTASLRFAHGDHLGSTNLITDNTGQVIEVSENTPYGTLYHHEGPSTSPHQFTGQRLDPSTGLHFYNARYYDSQLGRFISPDPFVQDPGDPQTLNRYSYVRNNPINLVDPSGYFSLKKLFKAIAWQFVAAAAVVVGIAAAAVGAEPVAAAAFSFAAAATVQSARYYVQAFSTPTPSVSGGATAINTANPAGLNATTLAQHSSLSLPGRAPSLLGQAVDSVLTPMYNSLVRPGWNYGEYLADLDAGRGVINSHLYGAMLDSLLVISNVTFTIEQAVVYGPQRSPFWRYVGPKSDPAGTWVVRGSRPSYGTDYELAMQRLSARNQWNEVKQASVPWDQYVAGPRPAAPQFGRQGFGSEYRVGGFGDWKGYVRNWWDYWKSQLFANSQ